MATVRRAPGSNGRCRKLAEETVERPPPELQSGRAEQRERRQVHHLQFEGRRPFETYRRDIEPALLGDDMLGALHEVVEGDDALGYTASLLDGAAPLEAAPPLALLAPRMAMRAGVSSRTRSNGSGAAAGVLDPSAPAPPGGGYTSK